MIEHSATGFASFGPAIGHCAVAWGERGIVSMQLPESTEAATRARMQRRHPGAAESAPPRSVQAAVEGVVALMDGEDVDLSRVELDMAGVPEFHRRGYELAPHIPPGRTPHFGEDPHRSNE